MVWSVWRSLATDCNAGDGESWICRACRLSCSALCARWDFPRSEQWIRTNGINKKYPKIRSKGTATSKNGSQTVSSCRQLRQCFSPSQMLQRSAVSESENDLLSFLFFWEVPLLNWFRGIPTVRDTAPKDEPAVLVILTGSGTCLGTRVRPSSFLLLDGLANLGVSKIEANHKGKGWSAFGLIRNHHTHKHTHTRILYIYIYNIYIYTIYIQ